MTSDDFKKFFNIENRTKYFVHVFVFLLLASIIIFGLLLLGNQSLNKKEKTVAVEKPSPFDTLSLEAKGVVVWDTVNEQEIFSKNPDEPLPLASLTKVMTALIASSGISDSSNIKIAEGYLAPDGDSNLVVGDNWRASDLRDFTLLTSSNDGAFALAGAAESKVSNSGNDSHTKFIKSMNDKAKEIGLLNTRFFNEHGLDREVDRGGATNQTVHGGAYGSAIDMALLFEYTLKNYPQILEATRYTNLQFASAAQVYSADNTNTAVDQIPSLLASKTGYTDLAGGNLVIAFDAGLNRPIIISVLGSTQEGRFSDALKLVEASLKYIHDN